MGEQRCLPTLFISRCLDGLKQPWGEQSKALPGRWHHPVIAWQALFPTYRGRLVSLFPAPAIGTARGSTDPASDFT